MKLHTTKYLYEYWNDLRGTKVAPNRKDLDPTILKDILPNLFLLDRMSRDIYNFRLAGTKTCSIFGGELRDKNFLSLWNQNDNDSFTSLLETLTEQGAAIVCGLKGRVGDEQIHFEFLALPLFHAQSEICSSVIGAFSYDNDSVITPDAPVTDIEIMSLRVIWPVEETVSLPKTRPSKNSLLQVVIDEAEEATSQTDFKTRRAQFRVIQGGKT